MQSNAKSNSIITSVFDAERNVITFTVLSHGDVELNLNAVSAANMARAAVHGFNQRIPDAAAIGVADSDGNIIPKAERTRIKYERMNDLCRHYESGTEEWSRVRGDGTPAHSITLEAVARVQGISYADAEAMVNKRAESTSRKPSAVLAKLRKAEAVAKAILAIKAERADGAEYAADADEELASLKGE